MRTPKVTIYLDDDGKWRWRWKAANGAIMADSGQGYADKRDCIGGLEFVTAAKANITFGKGSRYQQGELRYPMGLGTVFIEVIW